MVKTWLIDNVKETVDEFVIIKQNNEFLKFFANDFEKITHKTFTDLRENFVLKAVDY